MTPCLPVRKNKQREYHFLGLVLKGLSHFRGGIVFGDKLRKFMVKKSDWRFRFYGQNESQCPCPLNSGMSATSPGWQFLMGVLGSASSASSTLVWTSIHDPILFRENRSGKLSVLLTNLDLSVSSSYSWLSVRKLEVYGIDLKRVFRILIYIENISVCACVYMCICTCVCV